MVVSGVTKVSSRTEREALLKPEFDIAINPFIGRLPHGRRPLSSREFSFGPFEFRNHRRTRILPEGAPTRCIRPRVRSAGRKRVERIKVHERQRFELEFNFLDGFGGR